MLRGCHRTYLIPTGAGLEVLVREIELFDAKGASGDVSAKVACSKPQGKTYQNSSSSSMTESICWRLDMITGNL